ncbi:MAG: YegP family protein [Acidobacteria bacterium]|nr:YegP family protein [Acidobacteriota bacterium]MCA1608299.1 YegP family protein [Acidobacteriota bacterium]
MAGKFEIKTAKNGKTFFNLKASNGQTILSSEMYETRAAAENGVDSVKKNAGNDARFERKVSNKGENYFVLKAANGEPIGKSEMYASKRGMENGIKSVQKNAGAPMVAAAAVA